MRLPNVAVTDRMRAYVTRNMRACSTKSFTAGICARTRHVCRVPQYSQDGFGGWRAPLDVSERRTVQTARDGDRIAALTIRWSVPAKAFGQPMSDRPERILSCRQRRQQGCPWRIPQAVILGARLSSIA